MENKEDKIKLANLIKDVNNRFDELDKNKAIFVFGSMGAGKTTFIKNNLKKDNVILLAIDEYIKDLKKNNNEYNNEDLYFRAREIGGRFAEYLVEKKISVIVEGCGYRDDIFDYIDNLKSKGMKIKGYFIKTSLETAINRIKYRNSISDRKISIKSTIDAYDILWNKNFNKLIKNMDDYEIIDNDKYKFNTNTIIKHNINEINDINLSNEIMVNNASIEFCRLLYDKSTLTFTILNELSKLLKLKNLHEYNTTININIVNLEKTWYSDKPLWNSELCSRDKDKNIKPLQNKDEHIKKFIYVYNGPNIKVLKTRNISMAIPFSNWYDVDKYIESIDKEYEIIDMSNKFIEITGNELIKGVSAKQSCMRYIFTATYYPDDHPLCGKYKNDKVIQTQVYLHNVIY